MSQLAVILGDQLSPDISSLQNIDKKNDRVLLMEVMDEATYVKHHPKKIAFLFSAMRHFRDELKDEGYNVHYIPLDSGESKKSFTKTVQNFIEETECKKILVTEPGEHRVLEELQSWDKKFDIEVSIEKDSRFFCSIEDFKSWSKGKKQLVMETFYRQMRKKTGILMNSKNKPEGGDWNFDKENREPFKDDISIPSPKTFKPDKVTKEVLSLVSDKFSDHFGKLDNFWFAVTRKQAREALAHFIDNVLPNFGSYQDAMAEGEYFLFHSILSQYLNCGLLSPAEVCKAAEKAYKDDKAPINSVEGFVRQILGWREFIRGIYWLHMPDYAEKNFFENKRPLPKLYWGKKTKMNCMHCVIKQTEEEAQSHHIQRLMVTGNFALLAGIDPKEVCQWYLEVYADAYEWVELPNTLGMALYGDGGIVGTKPYAASGSYINRMSNFCKSCHYDVKQRTGEKACPFNFLYWDFMMRNKEKLKDNRRLNFTYKNLEKMDEKDKKAIKKQSESFLKDLN